MIQESDLFGVRRVVETPPDDAVTVVAYGGGVNSAAMLCGWVERALRPVDLILFSDTGAERPQTYWHIEVMSAWLQEHGYPAIQTVRKVDISGAIETLEQNCREHQMLPSLAYGYKKCSHKFKHQPQAKYVNQFAPARAAWHSGARIVKLIGFDADEPHRAARGQTNDAKYWYRYPLIEWGWGRSECVQAIERADLPVPTKSACFFCPANTVAEIRTLQREHPDLLRRALEIEAMGLTNTTSVQGLGRRFAWRDLIHGKPIPLFTDTDIACECYDGAVEDEVGVV